jgi:vacuolar protein 8
LAASSDRNKRALISAQAVQKCIKVLERKKKAFSVESEITAFFAVLAMSDELKRSLLGMGLCEVLVPLTSSENVEVQGNSAAAISNLASSGISPPPPPFKKDKGIWLIIAGDYSNFVRTWEAPGDGLRGFLLRFLASRDEIDQHIAVWTLTQLLESDGNPSPPKNTSPPQLH